MKAIHPLLTLVALCCWVSISQAQLGSGLIAHYTFEGNANDVSGTGNHATPAGNFQFSPSGFSGSSLRIVGDNSIYYSGGGHLALPTFDSSLNSGFTLSLWAKDEVLGGNPFPEEAYIHFQSPGAKQIEIMLNHYSTGYLRFAMAESGIGYSVVQAVDRQTFSQSWKQLAVTYQPGKLSAYLNGTKIGETNTTISVFPAAQRAMGRHYWDGGASSSARMTASLDNVRIYNRTLSDQEITSLYNFELNPPQPTVAISQQPQAVEARLGEDAAFDVVATGVGTLRYQWRFEGARIIGATLSTLTLTDVSALDFGAYTVEVTDDNGSIQSEPAQLTLFIDSDGDGLGNNYEQGLGRYELISGTFNWNQANADAQARGGHLVTIISSQEWDSIKTVIGSANLTGKSIWTGGNDSRIEGTWDWITDEPFTYFNWNGGEPNSVGGGYDSDFIEITTLANGSWNDGGGQEVKNYYLLERGYFTNPNNADTDGDGFSDGVEVGNGSLPTSALSLPVPRFASVPLSQTVTNGSTVEFTVATTGLGPISLQWLKNEVPIPGQTGLFLTLSDVGGEAAGNYSVTATNPAGAATSVAAQLIVTPLTQIQLLPGGFVFIGIQDIRPGPWRVERSADLETWDSIGTAPFNNGFSALLDIMPQGAGHRFYRAVSP